MRLRFQRGLVKASFLFLFLYLADSTFKLFSCNEAKTEIFRIKMEQYCARLSALSDFRRSYWFMMYVSMVASAGLECWRLEFEEFPYKATCLA